MIGQHHRYPPTDMHGGPGTVDELRTFVANNEIENALVVCGPTTASTEPVIGPVTVALGDRLAGVYDRVESHVPTDNVATAVKFAESHAVDLLVSLGGGSAHDTAKAISIMGAEGGGPHDYKVTREGDELVAPDLPAPKTPIVAIPTTLSAAELNGAAAITDSDTGEKMIVTDEKAIPKLSIYDPEIGIHTPKSIIAATGMNAIDHTVEMVYSRHHTPFTDATALRGLEMLHDSLPKTIEYTDDLEARQRALLGSALSGFGMEKGVCLNHAICHILGGTFNVPHGMRFNLPETVERQSLLAKALDVDHEANSKRARAERAIEEIENLRDELDAPSLLRETTVSKDDFDVIAAKAIKDLPITNNPKAVTADDIVDILEAAW